MKTIQVRIIVLLVFNLRMKLRMSQCRNLCIAGTHPKMTNEQDLARRSSPQLATPSELSQERSRPSQNPPGASADQSEQRDSFQALIKNVNYRHRPGASHSGSL